VGTVSASPRWTDSAVNEHRTDREPHMDEDDSCGRDNSTQSRSQPCESPRTLPDGRGAGPTRSGISPVVVVDFWQNGELQHRQRTLEPAAYTQGTLSRPGTCCRWPAQRVGRRVGHTACCPGVRSSSRCCARPRYPSTSSLRVLRHAPLLDEVGGKRNDGGDDGDGVRQRLSVEQAC
jgi:hypothetical protein